MERFFKYLSSDVAKIVLSESTLKYSHPNNFNDPFDYYPTSNAVGANKFFKRVMSERGQVIPPKTGFKKVIKNSQLLRSIQFRNKTSSLFCVTCFSITPYSLPMWAHYANNHNGCVIEFRNVKESEAQAIINDPNLAKDHPYLLPWRVYYSDKRPSVFDKNGETNTNDNGFMTALIKAKEWEYEQEARVIRISEEGIYKFSMTQVIAVYLGMKIPIEDKTKIVELIKAQNQILSHNIKIYQIQMEHNTFNLTKVRY